MARWGLRSTANFLNHLAGLGEKSSTEEAATEEEYEEEADELELLGKGEPFSEVVPEIAYVVAAKGDPVDASRFWYAERLRYPLTNLPSKEQVMEDLKKKTGLQKCEFYSCYALSGPAKERPFEMNWTPDYYNLVKVCPLD